MSKNNCITTWDYIVGGFGILLILQFIPVVSSIQNGTVEWTDPRVYLTAIAAGCGVILVLIALIKGLVRLIEWHNRKRRIKPLFHAYYEPELGKREELYTIKASKDIQQIPITLVTCLDTKVEFISIAFEDGERIPVIKGLYDWQRKDGRHQINVFLKEIKGTWYWEYGSPWHQPRKARITIGICCLAETSFSGRLMISMTTSSDGDKCKRLPFIVLVPFGSD